MHHGRMYTKYGEEYFTAIEAMNQLNIGRGIFNLLIHEGRLTAAYEWTEENTFRDKRAGRPNKYYAKSDVNALVGKVFAPTKDGRPRKGTVIWAADIHRRTMAVYQRMIELLTEVPEYNKRLPTVEEQPYFHFLMFSKPCSGSVVKSDNPLIPVEKEFWEETDWVLCPPLATCTIEP